MACGALTMQAARVLQPEFSQAGFDILHAHGQVGMDSPLLLGKICSWFGDAYKLETILADLDMAVVSHNAAVSHDQERVYALIEIEETTCRPKVILGDVLATLLGKGIKFQGLRDLQVGRWTSLIVMSRDKHQSQLNRLPYLMAQSKYLRENLLTPNASIGRVVIDTFVDDLQLVEKLRQNITEALNKHSAWRGA
jgi:hypothetical protein